MTDEKLQEIRERYKKIPSYTPEQLDNELFDFLSNVDVSALLDEIIRLRSKLDAEKARANILQKEQ